MTEDYGDRDGHGGTDTGQIIITITGVGDGNNADGTNTDGSAGDDDSGRQAGPVSQGFNQQIKTAAGRFEHERTAFLGLLAGDGARAA